MLSPSDKVKDYEVIAPLGSGGMAMLYLARRRGVGGFSRLVTLKLVHKHLIEDENMIKLFLDEARISAHVAHPNVVHVEEVGQCGDSYFIAMEYVHGVSLAELLARLKERRLRLRPKLCVWLTAQLAEALHAAHEAKGENGQPLDIVHHDVSPQNVLIGHTGHVKLIDFGIAKSQAENDQRAGRRAVLGKLRYMSPEQLRLERADRRTDVYALGVMLWEMLAGRPLFRCQQIDDERDWAMRENPPPPSKYSSHSTPALDRVVLKAIACDPKERHDSAFEFRAALLRADPEAVRLDAPMVAALMRTMLGDELDRRRASWPSEVSGELEVPPEITTSQVNLEELTADIGISTPSGGEDEDFAAGSNDDDDDEPTLAAWPTASRGHSEGLEVFDDDAQTVADTNKDEWEREDDQTLAAAALAMIRGSLQSIRAFGSDTHSSFAVPGGTHPGLAPPSGRTVPGIAPLPPTVSTISVTPSYPPDPPQSEAAMVVASANALEAQREPTLHRIPITPAESANANDTLKLSPSLAAAMEPLLGERTFYAAAIGSLCLALGIFLGALISHAPTPKIRPALAVPGPSPSNVEHERARSTKAEPHILANNTDGDARIVPAAAETPVSERYAREGTPQRAAYVNDIVIDGSALGDANERDHASDSEAARIAARKESRWSAKRAALRASRQASKANAANGGKPNRKGQGRVARASTEL